MQKYTVKMDCRQRNRQWKAVYFFVDTIVLLRKFVLRTYEKKARAKNLQKIFHDEIRHCTGYVILY